MAYFKGCIPMANLRRPVLVQQRFLGTTIGSFISIPPCSASYVHQELELVIDKNLKSLASNVKKQIFTKLRW